VVFEETFELSGLQVLRQLEVNIGPEPKLVSLIADVLSGDSIDIISDKQAVKPDVIDDFWQHLIPFGKGSIPTDAHNSLTVRETKSLNGSMEWSGPLFVTFRSSRALVVSALSQHKIIVRAKLSIRRTPKEGALGLVTKVSQHITAFVSLAASKLLS